MTTTTNETIVDFSHSHIDFENSESKETHTDTHKAIRDGQ